MIFGGGPMTNAYSMLIQWSDEDQVFIASLPEFGSGAKTHGATYEEAAKNGQEVLDLLVETYQAEGRLLPTPRKFESSESMVSQSRE
jgi:predicted RNase H-like HicB family nuclease